MSIASRETPITEAARAKAASMPLEPWGMFHILGEMRKLEQALGECQAALQLIADDKCAIKSDYAQQTLFIAAAHLKAGD